MLEGVPRTNSQHFPGTNCCMSISVLLRMIYARLLKTSLMVWIDVASLALRSFTRNILSLRSAAILLGIVIELNSVGASRRARLPADALADLLSAVQALQYQDVCIQ